MTSTIPGVILAGGRATRMGAGDKGFRCVGGKRLIDRVVARLKPQCGALALSANGDPSRFSDLELPVLPDSIVGFPGPLAGILAGLDWAHGIGADYIVTAAVDTPLFPVDLVDRLLRFQGASGLCIAATRGAKGRIFHQPTFGLWPVHMRNELRDDLNNGCRKVVAWTIAHDAGQAMFESDPYDPFFNINTPDDIATAETIIEGFSG